MTGIDLDTLPDPGTDEGWAALAAEAAHHGYPDPLAYIAAYQGGHVNVGFSGYQPGNPSTGFGQVQAYDQAAATAGVPLDQYASMHTPEALAEARGESPGVEALPFTPPANFTPDGQPIEYGPDGTSIVNNVYRELPDGVDHYDRYTGAPLDESGNIVPGTAYADDGYVFTTALDQRVGLNDDGMRDPAETERLDAEARAAGYESTADQVLDTTRPFPGHPGEPGDAYARPTVEAGSPPIAYSGPDGIYVVTSGGQVITGEPGGEIEYRGDDGSAVIVPGLKVVTTAPDGTTVSFDPSETPGGPAAHPDPTGGVVGPDTPPEWDLPGNVLTGIDDLGPVYDDSNTVTLDDGQQVPVSDSAQSTGFGDGVITNEFHDLDGEEMTTFDEAEPLVAEQPTFGQGDTTTTDAAPDPRVTTTADDLGAGAGTDDTPDPRVTTTADDLGAGTGADESSSDEDTSADSGQDSGQDAGDDSSSDSADLEPAG